ncbi:kunitz-like toxin PcKuz3 [Cochliomyia hominivorax]
MKLLSIFTLILVLFINFVMGQWQNCHGRLWLASCLPPANKGHGGRACGSPRLVWYYNRSIRQCRPIWYMGCGGNNNRWCSWSICQQRCR